MVKYFILVVIKIKIVVVIIVVVIIVIVVAEKKRIHAQCHYALTKIVFKGTLTCCCYYSLQQHLSQFE